MWELRVPLPRDPLTGHRRRRSVSFRGTKREAERELARLLVAAADEGRHTATQATVGVLLDRWWEQKRGRLSPTTAEEHRRLIARRIRPVFGRVEVGRLTAADLDAFYLRLERDGLAPSSIRQVHALLSGALKQGVKWRWISSSPARDASLPAARRQRIQPPSPDNVRALIAAEEHLPEMGPFIRPAALLGARRGEVCGLQWEDLDEAVGTIQVRRGVTEVARIRHSHADRRTGRPVGGGANDHPPTPASIDASRGARSRCGGQRMGRARPRLQHPSFLTVVARCPTRCRMLWPAVLLVVF